MRTPSAGARTPPALLGALLLLSAPLTAETVTGRVIDFLSRAPVPGARVEIPGSGETSTDADGLFSIDGAPAAAALEIRVAKGGFLDREAWGRAGEPIEVELVPGRAPGFEAVDFDLLSRQYFGKPAQRGSPLRGHLARWVKQPRFAIAKRVCDDGLFGEKIPAALLDEAAARLRYGAPLLSGGFVTARKVKKRAVPRGGQDTEFLDASRKREIRICLGPVRGVGGATEEIATGRLRSGFFRSSYDPASGSFSRYVFFHELGHALGMSHPAGYRAFELPSLMGSCGSRDEPEDLDILAGLVHYSRPPGNRHPDRDPAPFAAAGSARPARQEWDDSGLLGAAAIAAPAARLAVLEGAVSRRGPACPESLDKPCRIHRLDLDSPARALRVRLSWSGRRAGLGLHLREPGTGGSRGLEARSLACRRQESSAGFVELRDGAVGPGPLEIRVLYWSGTRARQKYTIEVFEEDF